MSASIHILCQIIDHLVVMTQAELCTSNQHELCPCWSFLGQVNTRLSAYGQACQRWSGRQREHCQTKKLTVDRTKMTTDCHQMVLVLKFLLIFEGHSAGSVLKSQKHGRMAASREQKEHWRGRIHATKGMQMPASNIAAHTKPNRKIIVMASCR